MPLAAGGQWLDPLEGPAHVHHPHQPCCHLVALWKATERAQAILMLGQSEALCGGSGWAVTVDAFFSVERGCFLKTISDTNASVFIEIF